MAKESSSFLHGSCGSDGGGGLPFGLFKSERTCALTANADGTTTFYTREAFSRSLLPLFGSKIPDLTERFEKPAAGLKELAEKGGST